jgi:hypothetical protein
MTDILPSLFSKRSLMDSKHGLGQFSTKLSLLEYTDMQDVHRNFVADINKSGNVIITGFLYAEVNQN